MQGNLDLEDLGEEQMQYLVQALHRRRVAAVGLYLLRRRRQNEERRRIWVRRWIDRRQEGRGPLHMIHNELRLQDTDSYKNYLRMDENAFEELLEKIAPCIQRQDTVMRQAITPRHRLIATLRFLACGCSYQDLSYAMRLPKCTLSLIVPDTLQAIVAELQDQCIKFPNSKEEWKEVEQSYRVLWNFPHCVGAIDGKHINFRPARAAGSTFRNYKGRDSIVLMALVDACYKFLFIDVGRNGRMNDAAVFRESQFGRLLIENSINLPDPDPEPLPGHDVNVKMPYVATGDDAFPLGKNLMKPYPSRGLTYEQRIFNYRLSRARRVVENAFGILANRFRILLTTIALPVEKVELITMSCCILHNFILARKPVPLRNFEGEDGSLIPEFQCNLRDLDPQHGNNPTRSAKVVRDYFKEYFNTTGAVPWQNEAVRRGNY